DRETFERGISRGVVAKLTLEVVLDRVERHDGELRTAETLGHLGRGSARRLGARRVTVGRSRFRVSMTPERLHGHQAHARFAVARVELPDGFLEVPTGDALGWEMAHRPGPPDDRLEREAGESSESLLVGRPALAERIHRPGVRLPCAVAEGRVPEAVSEHLE